MKVNDLCYLTDTKSKEEWKSLLSAPIVIPENERQQIELGLKGPFAVMVTSLHPVFSNMWDRFYAFISKETKVSIHAIWVNKPDWSEKIAVHNTYSIEDFE